jgi:hypothetical protein
MLRVLADPWDPGYGMGYAPDDEVTAPVDLTVEGIGWLVEVPGRPGPERCIGFVDGVRRIELRLLFADGDRRVPGALGSFAVGVAYGGINGGFGESIVGRKIVAGTGIAVEAFELAIGGTTLRWDPLPSAAEDDYLVQLAIQQAMRLAEAHLARRLGSEGCELLLVDGPLGFLDPVAVPVVGIVKRSMKRYLDGSAGLLLPRLEPGTRTPLFLIGDPGAGSVRYSWYSRIAALRPAWHDHAGLVRCELSAHTALADARRIADEVTALLPRFAGSAADPRTPQNLAPVAGLERRLRHQLGDETLVRRAALAELTRRERRAS